MGVRCQGEQHHALHVSRRGRGWATGNPIDLFTRTANNRQALGDAARHSLSKYQAPKRPMTIQEADTFIRGFAQAWLRHRTL